MELSINGIPENAPESAAAVYRSKMIEATRRFAERSNIENIQVTISNMLNNDRQVFAKDSKPNSNRKIEDDSLSIEKRALKYSSNAPIHSFDKLVFQEDIKNKLNFEIEAINALSVVHNELNYKVIKPIPRRGLILGGEAGTGKTTLAHAIADKLGLPILSITAADIESKYHGDGTQNLQAAFFAAQRDNAILHIEEADALCSQRLSEVTSGSEQAINSLRNQLFSCLDQYPVFTICTTNFTSSFDRALETRLRYINIPMPNFECRLGIWRRCLELPSKLNLSPDVSIEDLAKIDNVCGREITNAVEDAILRSVMEAKHQGINELMVPIENIFLIEAINNAKDSKYNQPKSRELNEDEKKEMGEKIQAALLKP